MPEQKFGEPVACFSLSADLPTETNPLKRGFGTHTRYGWVSLRERISDVLKRGYRRIALHLPDGNETSTNDMDADARVDSIEYGRGWMRYETIALVESVLAEAKDIPDFELIIYIGTEEDDLKKLRDSGENSAYVQRWLDSIDYYLDAPVSIAFDSMGNEIEEQPYAAIFKLVKELKRRQGKYVYVEALTQNKYEWLKPERQFFLESFWRTGIRGHMHLYAPIIGEEIIRWFNGHAHRFWTLPDGNIDVAGFIAEVALAGHTVALDAWHPVCKDWTRDLILEVMDRAVNPPTSDPEPEAPFDFASELLRITEQLRNGTLPDSNNDGKIDIFDYLAALAELRNKNTTDPIIESPRDPVTPMTPEETERRKKEEAEKEESGRNG